MTVSSDSSDCLAYRRSALITIWPIVLIGILLMSGCGRHGGPVRYNVSGKITYCGKPVPSGMVMFEPDAKRGNPGPQGYALIKDGGFSTNVPGGKGMIGGPQQIRVFGYNGVGITETKPYGKRLFPEYTLSKDLARGDTTLDIDVPK